MRSPATPARAGLGGRAAGSARAALRLLPFLAAGALFAHFAWFGLRPALGER